ncbi:hypothetical protein NL108_008070 [Boleophthalmus pectinirostris]|nr:hypothetical protein NL108_008070 [Boleophthalmus pectinirostris]
MEAKMLNSKKLRLPNKKCPLKYVYFLISNYPGWSESTKGLRSLVIPRSDHSSSHSSSSSSSSNSIIVIAIVVIVIVVAIDIVVVIFVIVLVTVVLIVTIVSFVVSCQSQMRHTVFLLSVDL